MSFDAFELADDIVIIGNHDRIKILPDLPNVLPDALQLFSPEEFYECVISQGEGCCQCRMYDEIFRVHPDCAVEGLWYFYFIEELLHIFLIKLILFIDI